MSDARWAEIDAAVGSAVRHFGWAAETYPKLENAQDPYLFEMAFQHAMQAGHTSMESALLRILDLFAEQAPSGTRWHSDLIVRVSKPLGSRPAILDGTTAAAADETRRFRSIAAHAYDHFDRGRAAPAATAAALLAENLTAAIQAFRQTVDP